MGYQYLAAYYDSLMSGVDYAAWADFYEESFRRYLPEKPSLVLDLGCGSGKMTVELARRGYDMIGIDKSAEMLARAGQNAAESGTSVLFVEQDMTAFELYGTVGAVVCSLDCINYLTKQDDVYAAFSGVSRYLDRDGLFLFDVNTVYKFKTAFADRSYVYDTEDVFCTWENDYNEKTKLCRFYLTFFTPQPDGTYVRDEEIQTERAWSDRTLQKLLEKAGFETLSVVSDLNFTPATEQDERHYFICRKTK